jgi:hypothetical protein
MADILLRAGFALVLLGFGILAYRYDRMRGRQEIQRFFLEAHMVRALREGRHLVRIPAAALKAAFQLKTRAHKDPSYWNSKPGRHPATEK